MKTKDLLTILSTAVGTGALTVFGFWSRPLEAGGGAELPTAQIAQPRFLSHGIAMTLKPVCVAFKTGESPEFQLTATNTTLEVAKTRVVLAMSSSAPVSPLARTVSVPATLWQEEQFVSLLPQESRTIALSTHTNLAAEKEISVSLREASPAQGPAVLANRLPQPVFVGLSFSTVTKRSPALALQR